MEIGAAPFVGAWIEIKKVRPLTDNVSGRTLRGCVD